MRVAFWLLLLSAMACGSDDVEVRTGTAVDHGRSLFDDPHASSSPSNAVACSTCHPSPGLGSPTSDRIFPGGELRGAIERPFFWGAKRDDLLESINDCRMFFMDARKPWTPEDEDARAMYAFLSSVPGPRDPIAFDIDVRDPPASSDATRGANVYARACKTCHGSAHSAENRLVPFAPLLPDEIARTHPLAPVDLRAFYVRRVRQGAFSAGSGSMPPFSREALSDDDLSALLAFLGV